MKYNATWGALGMGVFSRMACHPDLFFVFNTLGLAPLVISLGLLMIFLVFLVFLGFVLANPS